jgi:putative transposase
VTICVWKKENMFGEIYDGEMRLNEYGDIVTKCWDGLPNHYQHLQLDEFIVMPNHVHGIVVLTNVGAQFIAPVRNATAENQGTSNQGAINRAPTKNNGMNTVGEIVRAFKARCTHAVNSLRNMPGVPLWQRNYYEHVIRDEPELHAIREYIRYNPLKWEEDEENLRVGEGNSWIAPT